MFGKYQATPPTLTDGAQQAPLLNAAGALLVGEGSASDAAWDGEADDASSVAILKAIYAQNVTIIAHLAAIETNTGTP